MTSVFYTVGHPVSKWNMLFVLDPETANLLCGWVPGLPCPSKVLPNDFVRLRAVPAGVCKICGHKGPSEDFHLWHASEQLEMSGGW